MLLVFFLSVFTGWTSLSATDVQKLKGPSFDCSKAQTADEKIICENERLCFYDRLIAEKYGQLVAYYREIKQDSSDFVKQQKAWLKTRMQMKSLEKIQEAMVNRNYELQEKIAQIIIPKMDEYFQNPPKLQKLLERFSTPLAQSWLALLYGSGHLKFPNAIDQESTFRKIKQILIRARPLFLVDSRVWPKFLTYVDGEIQKKINNKKEMINSLFRLIRIAYDVEKPVCLDGTGYKKYPCFVRDYFPSYETVFRVFWEDPLDHFSAECSCPSSHQFFMEFDSYKSLVDLLMHLDGMICGEEQAKQRQENGIKSDGFFTVCNDAPGLKLLDLVNEQLQHDLFNLKNLNLILKMKDAHRSKALLSAEKILENYKNSPKAKKYYPLLLEHLKLFKNQLKNFLRKRAQILNKRSFLIEDKLSQICEKVALIIVKFESNLQSADMISDHTIFNAFWKGHYSYCPSVNIRP